MGKKRLREASGRFVKGREAVQDWGQAVGRANRGAGILTTSLGGLGSVLAGLGIAVVTQQIGRFGVESVQAAGQMEQCGGLPSKFKAHRLLLTMINRSDY